MLLLAAKRLIAMWPGLAGGQALGHTTARAVLAAAATFLLAMLLGPRLIRWLSRRFTEPIKSASADVERMHAAKRATPTMGGVFIVAGLVAALTIFGDWQNPYLPIAVGLAIALGALGICDDLIKLTTTRRGLSARGKLAAQSAIALVAAWAVFRQNAPLAGGLQLSLPLGQPVELGWLMVPLATLVIVGASNAVNLTDGLDGLAGGCLVWACGAAGVLACAAGNGQWAGYLGIPYIPGAGEMAVVAAALIGGLLAFLWFNCHPASVFMGDSGSLPLGGLLGLLAVVARQELLLVVVGGVFVVEALSVILQVASFRWRRKRVLLCAPLHHHFQLRGWPEDKIVVRFWIAGGLCALVGLGCLKLGPGQITSPAQQAASELIEPPIGNQERAELAELVY